VNHIEGHEQLTNKDNIFMNLKHFCDKSNSLNVFDVVPLTIALDFKSEHCYEQMEFFKGIHRLIEQNIDLSVLEINKKFQNF
jgi:hypothetical protein